MDETRKSRFNQRIGRMLEGSLPAAMHPPERLHQAMRYAVLSPGKRIRPRLLYATAESLGVPLTRVDGAAVAVECIHAYSLIHDDLPAMDNDALRRGRPTTHIAFDEATAILAGDALQAQAFEVLATHAGLAELPQVRAAQLANLAHAIGTRGMVGGQMLDMLAEGHDHVTVDELEKIHSFKTGALLSACVTMAAAAAENLSRDQSAALDIFAGDIGLAFQVRDDVLDIESSTEKLGKSQGADRARDKATYPALLGLDEAKALAERLYGEAIAALAVLDHPEPLHEIATEIVKRDY